MQKTFLLNRKCYFSSGHTYINKEWSLNKNKEVYGELFVEAGFGHNFELEVQISGEPSGVGFIMDLVELDSWLDVLAEQLDHKYLNDDVEFFKKNVPSLENIGVYCFQFLKIKIEEFSKSNSLVLPALSLNLKEDDVSSLRIVDGDIFLVRKYSFSGLHKHHNTDWSEEQNKEFYGKCSAVHGHFYNIIISWAGQINNESGISFNRELLDNQVKKHVLNKLHGKYLNTIIGNTSGETIALYISDILNKFIEPKFYQLRVEETRKNSFILENGDFK